MSTSVSTPTHAAVPSLGFVLDPEHEAHQPPEVAGGRRDNVRLLVSEATPRPSILASTPSVSSSAPATWWS